MNDSSFYITNTLKRPYPSFPYLDIKNAILGKKYELSVGFIGKTRAKKLNQTYRQKSYIPNVLSFPLDEDHGEIFICPKVADNEAAKFNLSKDGYIAFLFIHGLLHLKGYDHGDTMDKLEKRYLNKFNIA